MWKAQIHGRPQSRRLDWLAFLLLLPVASLAGAALPALESFLAIETPPALEAPPAGAITFSVEAFSREGQVPEPDPAPPFSQPHPAGTAGPAAATTARSVFETTAIDTPEHEESLESQALDACMTATGAASGNITHLSCTGQGIESLDGIEGLHALTNLELNDNKISDLSPLAHLTKLQSLKLATNRVEDLSPLAALAELTDLILAGNRIEDVAPLAELNQLVVLDLTSNRISDVDDLGAMESLRYLKLDDNEINDVSSLRHLTRLKFLHLSSNNVTLGVRSLAALSETRAIVIMHNDSIACSDLDALEDALAGDVLLRPGACVPY